MQKASERVFQCRDVLARFSSISRQDGRGRAPWILTATKSFVRFAAAR